MCTRIEAIQVVITNQYGRKKDLVKWISLRQYETFVSAGLIREPVRMPGQHETSQSGVTVKEWVATKFAFERAENLNLKAARRFRFSKEKEKTSDKESPKAKVSLKEIG